MQELLDPKFLSIMSGIIFGAGILYYKVDTLIKDFTLIKKFLFGEDGGGGINKRVTILEQYHKLGGKNGESSDTEVFYQKRR